MTLKQILVATDFSEPSEAALLYGRELAMRFGARLHVLHVAQDIYVTVLGAENYLASAPGIQQQIEDAAQQRLAEIVGANGVGEPDTIRCVLTAASPARSIVEYAKANKHRSDRDGHARPCRAGPPADGQRGGAGRACRPLPGAYREASGARVCTS